MSVSPLPPGGGEAARDRRAMMAQAAKISPSVGEDARDRRQALKTINTSLVKQGSRGADVSKLQRELKAAGFDPGPVDGIFGPRTEKASPPTASITCQPAARRCRARPRCSRALSREGAFTPPLPPPAATEDRSPDRRAAPEQTT